METKNKSNVHHGSNYLSLIECFCDVFSKFAKTNDLFMLLMKIQQTMLHNQKNQLKLLPIDWNLPCFVSMLTKNLKFEMK